MPDTNSPNSIFFEEIIMWACESHAPCVLSPLIYECNSDFVSFLPGSTVFGNIQ